MSLMEDILNFKKFNKVPRLCNRFKMKTILKLTGLNENELLAVSDWSRYQDILFIVGYVGGVVLGIIIGYYWCIANYGL